MLAAKDGRLEIARFLVERGADAHATNKVAHVHGGCGSAPASAHHMQTFAPRLLKICRPHALTMTISIRLEHGTLLTMT